MSPSWFRVPSEIDGEDADDSDPGLEVEEILAIAAGGDVKVPGYPVWLDICPSAALWNHEPTKVTGRTSLRCLMGFMRPAKAQRRCLQPMEWKRARDSSMAGTPWWRRLIIARASHDGDQLS
jgi:hypothetical protein